MIDWFFVHIFSNLQKVKLIIDIFFDRGCCTILTWGEYATWWIVLIRNRFNSTHDKDKREHKIDRRCVERMCWENRALFFLSSWKSNGQKGDNGGKVKPFDTISSLTSPTTRCLFKVVPEDLFDIILSYLEPWDLIRLDDSNLKCQFGQVVSTVRKLFRQRRAIILSNPWLELSDLGSIVAAYLTVDPIISREALRYVDSLIKSSRTSRNRVVTITNLEVSTSTLEN